MPEIKLRPIVFKVQPPPPYTLLYEQAVQNYSMGDQTIMPAQTWTTNKNFICYKMSVCVKTWSTDEYNSYYRGVCVRNTSFTDTGIRFGRNTNYTQGSTTSKTSTFFYTGIGTGSVGTDGQTFTGDITQSGASQTGYKANPDITTSTADGVITYRIVFDKAQNKAYCYITDKQVMVVDYGSTNVLGWPIDTSRANWESDSKQTKVDFGIQVYACDSLEAALEC